jgi:hypothetical protein
MESGSAEDEIVFVEYKGFFLSMTTLERMEFWDNMSPHEKKKHLNSVRNAVRKGTFCYCRIPGYMNPVIVERSYAKTRGFKIEKGISSSDSIRQRLKK